MARTPSTMVALGTPAPAFDLPDALSREHVKLGDFAEAKALLVMFICNHCPYVQHVHAALQQLGRDYHAERRGKGGGLAIVGINANDIVAYPDDAPGKMALQGYNFPYLFDETQAVAKAYNAACTPDFFLYDKSRRLAYRGQFDASRPNSGIPVTGADLRAAIDAVLAGKEINGEQKPSLGCNIKWKQDV